MSTAADSSVELSIDGMTCASCANRIEKKLNKLDGVTATVNYATEQAAVRVPNGYDPQQLVRAIEAAGYTATLPAPEEPGLSDRASADAALAALKRRLIISAVLSAPVIAMAMVPAWQFLYWQWVSLALAAPVVVWGAWPFHRAAWLNLKQGSATMDTLISLGTTAAFVWSVVALVWGTAGMPGMTHEFSWVLQAGDGLSNIYLEVAAGVTTFVLAGRYVEQRSKRNAGAALRALLQLGATEVTLLRDGAEVRVPAVELVVGDEFVVRPGEQIATDGTVVSGSSAVDRSLVTGESVPVTVRAGEPVVGATLNVSGRLVVCATRVGAETQLAQMAQLVSDAQNGKAAVQRLADRISGVFVPIVLAVAVLSCVVWLLLGAPASFAISAAVAVLVIACPCALGLAVPTALLVGTGRGAQLGILITGPEALEVAPKIGTVVLDKTGTVTTGNMAVREVWADLPTQRDEVLRLAGGLEAASEHPIAQAIAREAQQQHGVLPPVTDFTNVPGEGVRGEVAGRSVAVGRVSLLRDAGYALSASLGEARARAAASGHTVVAVGWDDIVRGLIVVGDTVKTTSGAAIAELKRMGLRPVLLTGDSQVAAQRVAAEVGIDAVIAGVRPHEKVAEVQRLQRAGQGVAMVGDGINDAPALAQADLGIAMGTGTDVAKQASDITLVRADLLGAVDAIRLSRRTMGTIRTNLFWAFAYNVAAIPVAALGLLNPMLAGGAMAFSSVCVLLNSLRLRGFQPLNAK